MGLLSSSSADRSVFTEPGPRWVLGARTLNASRLSDEESARSADASLSEGTRRLELFDFSDIWRVGFGGVARPEATLLSAEIPRAEDLPRSVDVPRDEGALKLSPRNPEEGCEPFV